MSQTDIFAYSIDRVKQGVILPEDEVTQILLKLQEILIIEPTVLVCPKPIVVVGDIHGQLDDLNYIFEIAAANGAPVETTNFLFLGDYVDRGYYSLNTFLLLALYKIKYPRQMFLLRGNHETRCTNVMYGFYNECNLNYGNLGVYTLCNETFDMLPLAAVIDLDVFAVHGGLSKEIAQIEDISKQSRFRDISLGQNRKVSDPQLSLLWSDPDELCQEWELNRGRGAGYLFGRPQNDKWRYLNRLSFTARSHQLVQEGFKSYFPRRGSSPPPHKPPPVDLTKSLIHNCQQEEVPLHGTTNIDTVQYTMGTVWSAPNYSYVSNNMATILLVRFEKDFRLVEFGPNPVRLPRPIEPLPTGYFA